MYGSPQLDAFIQERGIKSLISGGFNTEQCVWAVSVVNVDVSILVAKPGLRRQCSKPEANATIRSCFVIVAGRLTANTLKRPSKDTLSNSEG
jgi:hypothetical protein